MTLLRKLLPLKTLLALHRNNESCRDCHVRLDPWGIPFERYNAIGKYQPFVPKEKVRVRGYNMKLDQSLSGYRKYLESVYTEKVEASSGVPLGPIVDGMQDLKEYLLKDRKSEIAENMIRRLMTYGMGRSLSYLDRFDVEKLLEEAEGNGYKLQDMIISVCLSPSFTSAGRKIKSLMKKKSWYINRRELLRGGGIVLIIAMPTGNDLGESRSEGSTEENGRKLYRLRSL